MSLIYFRVFLFSLYISLDLSVLDGDLVLDTAVVEAVNFKGDVYFSAVVVISGLVALGQG